MSRLRDLFDLLHKDPVIFRPPYVQLCRCPLAHTRRQQATRQVSPPVLPPFERRGHRPASGHLLGPAPLRPPGRPRLGKARLFPARPGRRPQKPSGHAPSSLVRRTAAPPPRPCRAIRRVDTPTTAATGRPSGRALGRAPALPETKTAPLDTVGVLAGRLAFRTGTGGRVSDVAGRGRPRPGPSPTGGAPPPSREAADTARPFTDTRPRVDVLPDERRVAGPPPLGARDRRPIVGRVPPFVRSPTPLSEGRTGVPTFLPTRRVGGRVRRRGRGPHVLRRPRPRRPPRAAPPPHLYMVAVKDAGRPCRRARRLPRARGGPPL